MFRPNACNRLHWKGILRGERRLFRARRSLCLKITAFFLCLATLIYLIVLRKGPRWPKLEYGPRPARKEVHSYPIYEYTSLYRLRADLKFENSLDEKLIAVEKATRNSGLKTLLANHTIWQIASPREKKLWSTWANQWSDSNPDWVHNIITSTPDDLLPIIWSFPEIRDAMTMFPYIRKDLIRHILLWYHGGFYASIDTWSRVALHDCIPISTVLRSNDTKIGLMIGVATDEPFISYKTMEQWGWLRNFGFSQEIIWAPLRFNTLLRIAIVRSISHARTHEAMGKTLGIGSETKSRLIEEISGAAMFTDIVLESLSNFLSEDDRLRDPDAGIARRVTWKKFSKLKKPIWIEGETSSDGNGIPGLAILPINVWSNGQDHSHAGSDSAEDACVNQPQGINLKKTWRDKEFG